MVIMLISATILIIVAMLCFVYSGKEDELWAFLAGIICLAFGLIFLIAFTNLKYVGYPAPDTKLENNSVVKIVWSQPQPVGTEYLAIVELPDQKERLFTLNINPPTGWVRIKRIDDKTLQLVPFPEAPAEQPAAK